MLSKIDIEQYFLQYKHIYVFLLIVAIVAMVLAAVFYFLLKKQIFKGIATSLLSWSFIFFLFGYTNIESSNRLKNIVVYNYDMHPEYLKLKEIMRLEKLDDTISVYLISCIIIIVAICLVGFYYRNKKQNLYYKGILVGSFVMIFIFLSSVIYQKKITKIYKNKIVSFTKNFKS